MMENVKDGSNIYTLQCLKNSVEKNTDMIYLPLHEYRDKEMEQVTIYK